MSTVKTIGALHSHTRYEYIPVALVPRTWTSLLAWIIARKFSTKLSPLTLSNTIVFRQPAVYLHSLRAVAPLSPNGWPEAAFLLYKANSLLIFQSARLNCEKSSEARRPPEYRNMPVASLRVLVFLSWFPPPELAFCAGIPQHACGIFASPCVFIAVPPTRDRILQLNIATCLWHLCESLTFYFWREAFRLTSPTCVWKSYNKHKEKLSSSNPDLSVTDRSGFRMTLPCCV